MLDIAQRKARGKAELKGDLAGGINLAVVAAQGGRLRLRRQRRCDVRLI